MDWLSHHSLKGFLFWYSKLLFKSIAIDLNSSFEYQNKNPLREWCDNQSKKFDDKNFSDLFYSQLESTSKKLSIFSKKIGKNVNDLEIDDLVLLVEQS